jgi:hypothetical protein
MHARRTGWTAIRPLGNRLLSHDGVESQLIAVGGFMRFVSMRIATAMCGLFCVTAGVAADLSAEPFTLANAIQRSLSRHPTLNGFVFELKAQDARLAEARLPSGFQAEVLIEDAAGSGERRGMSAAQRR